MILLSALLLLGLPTIASTLEPCNVSLFARSYIAVLRQDGIAMVDGKQNSLDELNAEIDSLFARNPVRSYLRSYRLFYTMNFEHLIRTGGREKDVFDVGLICVQEMAKREFVYAEDIRIGEVHDFMCHPEHALFYPWLSEIRFDDSYYIEVDLEDHKVGQVGHTITKLDILPQQRPPCEAKPVWIFDLMGQRSTKYTMPAAVVPNQLEAGKFYLGAHETSDHFVHILGSWSSNTSCYIRKAKKDSEHYVLLIIPKTNGSAGVDLGPAMPKLPATVSTNPSSMVIVEEWSVDDNFHWNTFQTIYVILAFFTVFLVFVVLLISIVLALI